MRGWRGAIAPCGDWGERTDRGQSGEPGGTPGRRIPAPGRHHLPAHRRRGLLATVGSRPRRDAGGDLAFTTSSSRAPSPPPAVSARSSRARATAPWSPSRRPRGRFPARSSFSAGCSAADWPQGCELRVRVALHSGEALLRDPRNYVGPALNRCARLRAAAHGGQTLVSRATYELVAESLPEGASLRALGPRRLRDLARAEELFELTHPELPSGFPPPRSLDALPQQPPGPALELHRAGARASRGRAPDRRPSSPNVDRGRGLRQDPPRRPGRLRGPRALPRRRLVGGARPAWRRAARRRRDRRGARGAPAAGDDRASGGRRLSRLPQGASRAR